MPDSPLVVRSPVFNFRDAENNLYTVAQLRSQIPEVLLDELISLASPSLFAALNKNNGDEKARWKKQFYRLRSAQRCVPFGGFVQLSVLTEENTCLGLTKDQGRHELVCTPSGQLIDRMRSERFDQVASDDGSIFLSQNLEIVGAKYHFVDTSSPRALMSEGVEFLELIVALRREKKWGISKLKLLSNSIDTETIEKLCEKSILTLKPNIPDMEVRSFAAEGRRCQTTQLAIKTTRRDSAKGKPTYLTNSYSTLTPVPRKNIPLKWVHQNLSELSLITKTQNTIYRQFCNYFAMNFTEGPVNLSLLARHLDPQWHYSYSHEKIGQNGIETFLQENLFVAGNASKSIDLSKFTYKKWIAPHVERGSALITLGERANSEVAMQVHSMVGGAGVEFLGRFYGDNTKIDAVVDDLAGQFTQLHSDEEIVELCYRPNADLYNITNRRKIFQKILVIADSYNSLGKDDYRLCDIEMFMQKGNIKFRQVNSGQSIRLTLPHAVNFTNEVHLPIYRVLGACSRSTNIGFHWPTSLSSALYHPRVTLNNTIWVKPQSWRLNYEELTDLKSVRGDNRREYLKRWLHERIDQPEYEVVKGDGKLIFHIDDPEGLDVAASQLTNPNSFVTESFSYNYSLFQQPSSPKKNHEIVVPFHINTDQPIAGSRFEVEISIKKPNSSDNHVHDAIGNPFWLNYEIYCQPSKVESILVHRLHPIISTAIANGEIHRWFFIRYGKDGWHIRLRLKVVDLKSRWKIAEPLEKVLYLMMHDGDSINWKSGPYIPENIRYGEKNIDTFFNCSFHESELAIDHFRKNAGATFDERICEDVIVCATLAHHYLSLYSPSLSMRIELLKRFSSPKAFKKAEWFKNAEKEIFESFFMLEQTNQTIAKCIGEWSKIRSFDLTNKHQLESTVHMCANRVMSTWTREREQTTWFLLLRAYQRIHATNPTPLDKKSLKMSASSVWNGEGFTTLGQNIC